jgi:hypothetical protein
MLSKNGLRLRRTVIPFVRRDEVGDGIMMGRRSGDQASLFYEFRLDDRVPKNHLLRRINAFVTAALADVHEQLDPYYSEIGRLSVSTSRLSTGQADSGAVAGWDLHPLESAALSRRTPEGDVEAPRCRFGTHRGAALAGGVAGTGFATSRSRSVSLI